MSKQTTKVSFPMPLAKEIDKVVHEDVRWESRSDFVRDGAKRLLEQVQNERRRDAELGTNGL